MGSLNRANYINEPNFSLADAALFFLRGAIRDVKIAGTKPFGKDRGTPPPRGDAARPSPGAATSREIQEREALRSALSAAGEGNSGSSATEMKTQKQTH